MESEIVTVFASIVTVSVFLAVVIGLGNKYYDQEMRKADKISKY